MSFNDELDNFKEQVRVGDRYFNIKRNDDESVGFGFEFTIFKVSKILDSKKYNYVKCQMIATRVLTFARWTNVGRGFHIWKDLKINECAPSSISSIIWNSPILCHIFSRDYMEIITSGYGYGSSFSKVYGDADRFTEDELIRGYLNNYYIETYD